MPVDDFVVCQYPFANNLNPDEDQQNVGLDQDQNCLHSDGGPECFSCKNLILKKVSVEYKNMNNSLACK